MIKRWTDQFKVTKPINELTLSHLEKIIKMMWKRFPLLESKLKSYDIYPSFDNKTSCIMYLQIALTEIPHNLSTPTTNMKYGLNGDIAQSMIDTSIDNEYSNV